MNILLKNVRKMVLKTSKNPKVLIEDSISLQYIHKILKDTTQIENALY